MDPRTVKPKTSPRLIAMLVLLGVIILGFVYLAIFESGTAIRDARMTGTVVGKEFVPSPNPEFQVTLGRQGGVDARRVEGEFILTVEVPQPDRTRKPFKVWLTNREQFDAINVGDPFDVGPYLVR
jgi:hypothetical protein